MTKTLLYTLLAAAALTSCTEDYTDWAGAQSNAANEAAETFTLSVTPGLASVDFATEQADSLQLFTTNLSDGQTAAYTVSLAPADGAGSETPDTLTLSPSGKVATADLHASVQGLYGPASVERTLSATVSAYVTLATADGSVVTEKRGEPFTFTATPHALFADYIYYAGDYTGWQPDRELALVNRDAGIYEGYYYILAADGVSTWGIKFVDENGSWYGGSDGVIDAAQGNIMLDQSGFYKIHADWMNKTYELTLISSISIIGGATGDSSWATDLDLTWDGTCWTYTGALDAGEFKFRANHDWSINWGGTFDSLHTDGANLSIDAAGTYTVCLYPNCEGKAYCTVTAQ